jgi:Ni2+-binding GTPase involved in maturation of urease and hydrogenase
MNGRPTRENSMRREGETDDSYIAPPKAMRFIMLGGFLGAGKTTALARLASHYASKGLKVGLVTNDQANDLVDTNSLRAQGFAVEEVPGACFCCKFDELVDKVGALEADGRPDVILAEPVGSCTDLVATVVRPLKDLYQTRFSIAPYAVLFKPSHGLRVLRSEGAGFSPKAAYIFRKQLEEADAIVVNRIDEIARPDMAELRVLLSEQLAGTPVLFLSAKSGENFESLVEFLDQDGQFGGKVLDIDYDVYAEGEAELGWVNCSMKLSSGHAFVVDDLLLEIVARLSEALGRLSGEVAHLKVIALNEGGFGVANLVSSQARPELSLASRLTVDEADLVVNARVAVGPAKLGSAIEATVKQIGVMRGIGVAVKRTQSLRPGRPTPTHRYAAS